MKRKTISNLIQKIEINLNKTTDRWLIKCHKPLIKDFIMKLIPKPALLPELIEKINPPSNSNWIRSISLIVGVHSYPLQIDPKQQRKQGIRINCYKLVLLKNSPPNQLKKKQRIFNNNARKLKVFQRKKLRITKGATQNIFKK